jgi:hypothetical protein
MRPGPGRPDHGCMDATEPPVATGHEQTGRAPGGGQLALLLVLGCSLVATTATGLVVGWFAASFQLMGGIPTSGDHRMAAGAYGATAALMVLGVAASQAVRAPRWMLVWAAGWAGVMLLLALGAWADSAGGPGDSFSDWPDGAGGVLMCPWTWPIPLLVVLLPWRGRLVSA